MTRELSIDEIRSVLRPDEVIHPDITPEASEALGDSAGLIESVGLPKGFGDLFKAADRVALAPEVGRYRYSVDGREHEAEGGVRIGTFDRDHIVVDPETGCVVFVEPGESAAIFNTSVARFLYFVGRFNRSDDRRYADIEELARDLREADPAPFTDPEGAWSVKLEEAEDGMY